MNMAEFAVATGDQALCRNEGIQLGEGHQGTDCGPQAWAAGTSLGTPSPCSPPTPDHKNNILKERAGLAHNPLPAKNIDLDKGDWLGRLDPHPTPPTLRTLKTLVSTLPWAGSSWAGVPRAGAPQAVPQDVCPLLPGTRGGGQTPPVLRLQSSGRSIADEAALGSWLDQQPCPLPSVLEGALLTPVRPTLSPLTAAGTTVLEVGLDWCRARLPADSSPWSPPNPHK